MSDDSDTQHHIERALDRTLEQVRMLESDINRLRGELGEVARERDQALIALDEANRQRLHLAIDHCRTHGALVGVSIAGAGLVLISLASVIGLILQGVE